ncbi:MAG: hypothetical protein ACLPQS_07880 [Acidimicrobiales bacterium]
MTFGQTITWTAVPNGFKPGTTNVLQISVVVSPRLTSTGSTDEHLVDYRDWLDWPSNHVKFTVKIGTHKIHPSSVHVVAPALMPPSTTSSELWRRVFDHATPVVPFAYNTSFMDRDVLSYPLNYVREWFVNTYTDIASKYGTNFPTIPQLFGPYAPVPVSQDALEVAKRKIASYYNTQEGKYAIPPQPTPDPPTDLLQTLIYTTSLVNGEATPPPQPPLIPDFHQTIGTLGKYPVLLRAFSLVYDLEVDLPSGLPSTVGLSVDASWHPTPTGFPTTNVFPIVQTTSATWVAEPRPTKPKIFDGQLILSKTAAGGQPLYPVIEVDVDGATIKTFNFVDAVDHAQTMRSLNSPTTYSVPSLRSNGLVLGNTGAAYIFTQDQAASSDLNTAIEAVTPAPVLYAEDITHGARIDVLDGEVNEWAQLCARVAPGTVYPGAPMGYVIGRGGKKKVVPLPTGNPGSPGPEPGESGAPFDEGWIEISLTQSAPGMPKSSLYLHETLFRWTGWSLVADRPGRHWAEKKNKSSANEFNPPNSTTNVPIQVSHAAAPHTLLALRFGHAYRFRARTVDLAGNSKPFIPTVTSESLALGSPTRIYARMEPVISPILIPAASRTPGEHLFRMVIRSETYATDDSTVTPCIRHVSPPSVAEEMAEAHGVLDVSGESAPDQSLYNTIASRAGMTYASAQVVATLGGVADPVVPGNYQWPSGVFYYPGANLAVPYMPDPICRGASFQFLPGTTPASEPVVVPFLADAPWPATTPVTLQLNAGTGAPSIDSSVSGDTLNVYIPQGTFLESRISSFMNVPDLALMGLWQWLIETGLASSALERLIATGQHWMFTPYDTITFVHAVRQPNPPTIHSMTITTREPNKTWALVSGTVDVDFSGSQKIDLMSYWETPYDDGYSAAGSVPINGNAHVADLPLELAQPVPQSVSVSDVRHDFGDTKYRSVNYQAQATSRFLEYFEQTVSVTITGTSPASINAGGFAAGSVIVASSVTTGGRVETTTYAVNSDYIEDDEAGTIALVSTADGGTIPSGTPLDITFVAPPVTNTSAPVAVPVPSTARPAAPDVRYIVPLFKFETVTGENGAVTSTRTGNALRVYLGRPWYSSGDGEELGVVLWPTGHLLVPGVLGNLFTQYGRDPIRTTNPTKVGPVLADFTLMSTPGPDLNLAEGASLPVNPTVDVAGHTVQFEGTSHYLWYADIAIDTSSPLGGTGPDVFSEWPFIRLGLVRFQPNSIANNEISRVVVADVIQLAPDRVASVTFPIGISEENNTVNVSVTGVASAAGTQIGVPPRVVSVNVQEQVAGITDPDLQWADVPGTEVTLDATEGPGYQFTWQGTVTLPSTTASLRLRITETEVYLYTPAIGPPTYEGRIVYLDTIPL